MPAIQIGNYTRPGLFINEFDNSLISSPTVTGLSTLVIGFSKVGPINTPVLLQNVNDIQNIFGPIDTNLERKGSFFHRTLSQMIQSSKVYAINLLATDDVLDTIQYNSLSCASDKDNDVVRNGSYRKFHNTTGFWKLDKDAFVTLVTPNPGNTNWLVNFTNVSGSYATVFIFKSAINGFDRTLLSWYGSVANMPPYVNQLDYASDYMVDVVIVSGDWTNYNSLSVDSTWSKYFDNTGLLKGQVSNFVNNGNVTVLKYYTGLSLIPYFRDQNGRNIFIETNINADTQKTGIFCAYNNDLMETDYPNGIVDLIGNNLVQDNALVDQGITDIDFLSYSDSIVESVSFCNTILDKVGNVYGIDGSGGATFSVRSQALGAGYRTGYYAEGFVSGLFASYSTFGSTSSLTITYGLSTTATGDAPYAIIGGSEVFISGTYTATYTPDPTIASGATSSYTYIYLLSNTGVISAATSSSSIQATDIVLGQLNFAAHNNGTFSSFSTASTSITHVSVNTSGYKELVFNTDYSITESSSSGQGTGALTVTFLDTAVTPSAADFVRYRRIKMFNNLTNLLDSADKDKMAMLINTVYGGVIYNGSISLPSKNGDIMCKAFLSNMTVTNVVTSTTSNKSFVLNTNQTSPGKAASPQLTYITQNGLLMFYKVDDEVVLGQYGMTTKNTSAVNLISGTTSDGVVSAQSTFYKDFYSGKINTGDYFYSNLNKDSFTVTFGDYSGTNYVIFTTVSGTGSAFPYVANGETVIIPDSVLNPGAFTVTSNVNGATAIGFANTTYNFAYKINISTTAEVLTGVTKIWDYNNKHYLQMYMDSSNNLHVKFLDNLLEAATPISITLDSKFLLQSDKSNFKESVMIAQPTGYTPVVNKVLVLGTEYTNIAVGDFLEAYVDESTIAVGQVARRLTRILSKKLWTVDNTYIEITCDSAINKTSFNGTLQTMRYTEVENYISTYKGISLKGFRVRQASTPDGTEAQQNAILNLIASGTPLFKAITNKDAIDVRYLIDSFGLGLIENSKQQLMDICGARLDCLGFLNMPSMKAFKESSSPSFVDADGVLQTSFIAQGGDPQSNPAFLYSFGSGVGTTCVGYFCPYVTVNDNGRPTSVPPAMFVATTYMRKQTSKLTSIVPWTIAAGVTNGKVVNIAGTEMSFTPDDISNLNLAQMNPIVYKRNRGYDIETENTAQTLYKSALSYLHVREVLIELERELSAMLLDFQWKFNTADVRSEIKLRADVICAKYVSKNGLYNYFNKCDSENNTQTVIDNQIGVLDTYVEVIRGMGVIVNNITILRTGAISSGGFISQ